jgi:hypothetical protein
MSNGTVRQRVRHPGPRPLDTRRIFQQGGHDMFYGAGGIVLLIVIILFLTGRL